jgi:hypothetical protein
LLPLPDKVPATADAVGRPRHRPEAPLADRSYDHDKYRRLLWARGIRPVIAERGEQRGSGLGTFRYAVADDRLAARLPSAADPLGTTGRHREAFLGLAPA